MTRALKLFPAIVTAVVAVLAVAMLTACGKPTEPSSVPKAAPASKATAPAGVAAPSAAPVATPPAEVPAAVPVSAADDDKTVNQAIDAALGDHAKYATVIHAFQRAVTDGDKTGVAALVDYPIAVTIDGKDKVIKDAKAFVADYDRFMTPAIVETIKSQKYGDLFVNYKGVMFGRGEAWINGICKDEACNRFDVKVVALQPGPE